MDILELKFDYEDSGNCEHITKENIKEKIIK